MSDLSVTYDVDETLENIEGNNRSQEYQ